MNTENGWKFLIYPPTILFFGWLLSLENINIFLIFIYLLFSLPGKWMWSIIYDFFSIPAKLFSININVAPKQEVKKYMPTSYIQSPHISHQNGYENVYEDEQMR